MPTFALEKLVRDGLLELYEELKQKAVIRVLEGEVLRAALHNNLKEEIEELLETDTNHDEIISELADVWQVIKDLSAMFDVDSAKTWHEIMSRYPNITQADVEHRCAEKLAKKGGFSGGFYITTLTLTDGDPWAKYYRNEPKKYKELP